jgi:hypothetical protein
VVRVGIQLLGTLVRQLQILVLVETVDIHQLVLQQMVLTERQVL